LVLLINGEPVARLVADTKKVRTGRDVAADLAKVRRAKDAICQPPAGF